MNKELILKYKKEFDHHLQGGSILYSAGRQSGWHWQEISGDAGFDWNLPEFYHFIINDKYSQFRCALAEGKTIQILCDINTNLEHWEDREPTKFRFESQLSSYRIKK